MEFFFCEGQWSERTINAFIVVLGDEIIEGKWKVNGNNTHSLQTAQEFVNIMFEKDFSWDDVLSQRNMLKKRYITFKAMLELYGVIWDRELNHVYAMLSLWIQMNKANGFARVFYHKGDLMYKWLEALFGSNYDISNEIINVFSNEASLVYPNNPAQHIMIPDSVDEQEVESPLVIGHKPLRTKLFDEPDSSLAHVLVSLESRTAYNEDVDWETLHSGALPIINEDHFSNVPSPRKIHGIQVKKENLSVASCSPLKWSVSPRVKK